MESLGEKVEQMIEPFLKEMNIELVELNIRRHKNETTIQILVDKRFGGITLAECTGLNRRINETFEKDQVWAGHYELEVSSPGLDRPLRTVKDFLRVTGRKVRFFLSVPVENKVEYAGVVRKTQEETVLLDVESRQIVIPLNKINKAVQII